ncbi:hypothetical protein BDA99DRAFT_518701 [Phascolomyces articulosus]|uniref:Uncharacterized protein n=1 Tax=Phascolomyces articulosus TaxID=60185 RepID=A0AAD5K3T3_9FUNG|nr:hypothetical protein BDA99DRAFT_518701 [Phascolomyces articulosus]
MSCQSCSGCFTGKSCHTTRNSKQVEQDHHQFKSLLQLALTRKNDSKKTNLPLHDDASDHDHIIPTIVSQLSDNIYASQVALFSMYSRMSLEEFIELAEKLYDHEVTGSLVAWAWEYCHQDPVNLLSRLRGGGVDDIVTQQQELWDHLDGQAEVHEVFNGTSVGRVKR